MRATLSPYARSLLTQIERGPVAFPGPLTRDQVHAIQQLLDLGMVERCTAFRAATPTLAGLDTSSTSDTAGQAGALHSAGLPGGARV